MSNVTLQIGGRAYTVACGEGQEAHISALGEAIDGKLASLGGQAGQNEARALLFAALLLADEVHDLRRSGNTSTTPPNPNTQADETDLSALEALAERVENLATRLER